MKDKFIVGGILVLCVCAGIISGKIITTSQGWKRILLVGFTNEIKIDLNGDGKKEVIRESTDGRIAPPLNIYTFYDDVGNEIGKCSIFGKLGHVVYYKDNMIKFSYHPYGGKIGYVQEKIVELNF